MKTAKRKTSKRFAEAEEQMNKADAFHQLRNAKDGIVTELPLAKIRLDSNIRNKIDINSDEFESLKFSISKFGLIQHPVVAVGNKELICVAGHRRILALMALGKERAQCIVKKYDKGEQQRTAQLIENTVREDLKPLEFADTVRQVKDDGGFTVKELTQVLGKDRKYIERLIKISSWPDESKTLILEHTEKFLLTRLLQIASKKLNDSELLAALKKVIEPQKPNMNSDAEKPSIPAHPRKQKRLQNYYKEKQLTKKQQVIIEDFLKTMKIKGWISL